MFWMRCEILLGSQGTKPAHFHEFSGMQISALKMAGGFKER